MPDDSTPGDRITVRTLALAAVGAPLAARRAVRGRIAETRQRLRRTVVSVAEETERHIEDWADEGENLVSTLTGTRPVDEITSRVDFDRIEDRVVKARRQLEEVVSTWRESGRRAEPSPEPEPRRPKASAPKADEEAPPTVPTRRPAATRRAEPSKEAPRATGKTATASGTSTRAASASGSRATRTPKADGPSKSSEDVTS